MKTNILTVILAAMALELLGSLVTTTAGANFPRYILYWNQRTDVGSPGPRYGHALAYDSDRGVTVFFGGEYSEVGGDSEYFNDTWEYDGASWKKITIDGPVPEPRSRHAMCYDNTLHQVILFGGITDGKALSDVWNYESTGAQRGRWINRPQATGPSPRYAHTMVFDYFQGVAIVAGGSFYPLSSKYAQTGEVWEWKNSTGQWFLQPDGVGFYAGQVLGAGLTDHMMLYDYNRHEAVVAGGIGPYGTKLQTNGKMWFPGSNKGSLDCGGSVIQAAAVYDGFHDIYFEFGGNDYVDPEHPNSSYERIWFPNLDGFPCSYRPDDLTVTSTFVTQARQSPGARALCAMIYDEKRRATVLFGGIGGTRYSDTWEVLTHDRLETWADFNYRGREIGTFPLPFNTFAEGVANVAPGGILKIKSSISSETLTVTNSMTIQAIGGPVVIGRR